MMEDPIQPTSADSGSTDRSNLSTEHQQEGDAQRPSDTLDKGQPDEEALPRKSSLT